ncbi:hypothetical protein F511_40022 [Dorcoceras hygrometricum]|uniref:Uncharacterized protein n=1 Tax=Dorcoceras hygrometricum TaxID=472368 RepID=A0A2Z7DH74_9LAMI|nr:hypothetical protein F511_40022 [Dorcoceras hygrometricum]
MAASFYSNSVHVDFESVLAMGEPVEFFANGTVRDGLVVSSVNGVVVEISEELFAATFDLPVVGLLDVSEMPKDKIFDARSIVSLSGEPVILSGSKSQMKMHYRLLCDIMANVLFGIFKKMVTPGSKQAKGFAIQISHLLDNVPNLELGESSEFPSSKTLTDKTIQRYIAIIDKSGEQEPVDAPKLKKAPKTKVASMKRPADFPLDGHKASGLGEAPMHVGVDASCRGFTLADISDRDIWIERTVLYTNHDRLVLAGTIKLRTLIITYNTTQFITLNLSSTRRCPLSSLTSPPPPSRAAAAAADLRRKFVSGRFDEENPFVQNSSVLLVQPDEGVSVLVVDRIGDYLPQSTGKSRVLVIPVGARHKFQQRIRFERPIVPVSPALEPMVEDQQAEFSTEQPADELPADKSAASTKERHCDEIKDDKPIVDDPDTVINQVLQHLDSTSADKNVEPDEEASTMGVVTAGEDQQVQEFLAENANDDLLDADEQKSLDNGLPKIPADHKGKAVLVEKDPIKGNPAQEHFFLICADIDLLVALRAKVIDDVALFFNSFSLKKLATINIEEMYKKEELVLSWGETESPQEAIQRKSYILLKYRKVLVWKFLESWRSNFVLGQGSSAVDRRVIELLSDLHVSILEELTRAARAHVIIWKKPCCSTMFEGSSRDRGAVITRTNMNTRSSCWIITMILVDGVWTVEPCADKWVKIPRQVISNEVHRQRQFDDTLSPVSEFFRLMRKRWADVCLEVTEFCAYRRLLPVGYINFCRALEIVEPDSCVDFRLADSVYSSSVSVLYSSHSVQFV